MTARFKRILMCLIIVICACIIGIMYSNVGKQEKHINGKSELVVAGTQQTVAPDGYTAITNEEELMAISDNLAGNYILMADIDLTGKTWVPVGTTSTSSFSGIFDGNYYTISNMNIESAEQYTGIFGYIKKRNCKKFNIRKSNSEKYIYLYKYI